MAGTNIKIGGGSGSSGGGAPDLTLANLSEAADLNRFIFNDMLSTTTSHVPLLPHTLISGAFINQGGRDAFDSPNARSIFPIIPSAANANSGISFYGQFGFALGKNSYMKCIVRFEDLGSDVENDTLRFTCGFNSSNSANAGNAGVLFKIIGREIQLSYRPSGGPATTNTPLTAFAQYGKFLIFEIKYLERSIVNFKITDADDGTVYFDETIDDPVSIPSLDTQGSGDQVNCISICTKTTTGTSEFVTYDYLGYKA